MADVEFTPPAMARTEPVAQASFIDMECHVLPLLRLAQWASEAGEVISRIQDLKYVSSDFDTGMRTRFPGMTYPARSHGSDLVAGALWVAIDLLERLEAERTEAGKQPKLSTVEGA